MSEREIKRLTFALRWMATEWAKYAQDHPRGVDVPHPDLVQGGVDMALEAADRELDSNTGMKRSC